MDAQSAHADPVLPVLNLYVDEVAVYPMPIYKKLPAELGLPLFDVTLDE